MSDYLNCYFYTYFSANTNNGTVTLEKELLL